MDSYYLPSSLRIKFKRKRALMAGISLAEAQDHRVRLSSNDAYTIHDLHADSRHKIQIRINVRDFMLTKFLSTFLLIRPVAGILLYDLRDTP